MKFLFFLSFILIGSSVSLKEKSEFSSLKNNFIDGTELLEKHALIDASYFYSYLNDPFDNGYPESKYNEVIAIVKKLYAPIVAAEGGEFDILDDWTDGAVNAWAYRLGQEYWLEIPGGLSRYYLINEEAFIVTICHELGHLLGGEPKVDVISLEGQSDYFATRDCAEKLLQEINAIEVLPVDQEVEAICQMEEDSICQRTLKGALSITSYFAEIANEKFPKLSTPSPVVVTKTLTIHPPAQCRLDTLHAGFFNKKRPQCWYAK